jgi:hypothetical protein
MSIAGQQQACQTSHYPGRYEDIIFEAEAYAPLTTAAVRRAGAAKHKGIHRLKVVPPADSMMRLCL